MKKKKGSKLHFTLWAITLIPMFCLWFVISVVSINKVKEVITEQAKSNLHTVLHSVTSAYYEMSNDDVFYFLEEDGEYYIMKGELCLNYEMDYILELKEATGMDISFFNENIRVMTTLTDSDGEYLTGTTVKNYVKTQVIDNGEEVFFDNVYIDDVKSFSYYAPLYNPDDTIVGMVGISKPADTVNKDIFKVVAPMLTVTIILMIIAGAITAVYSENLIKVIDKTKNFLSKVAVGNLSCTISSDVLKRNDEIGDIGRSAVDMQKSLKSFVERDALTGLLNRRYGNMAFVDVSKNAENTGETYSVCLCDIDFFKKVNDTYGHDAGDLVLKAVANVISNHMVGKGYSVRWGGEEFLLVFKGISEDTAKYILEGMIEEIREMEVVDGDNIIKVTMTFGLVEKTDDIPAEEIINKADELLYYGKSHGRNQIVRSEDIG
ncbi:MAG: diguanylate cyclase [Lachnospiraceae bacterium]|nr:diguanylate cyclase [Lachnospiraceae bacterium]